MMKRENFKPGYSGAEEEDHQLQIVYLYEARFCLDR